MSEIQDVALRLRRARVAHKAACNEVAAATLAWRAAVRNQPLTPEQIRCDHIPKRSALDDSLGCIRCGVWLLEG